MMSCVLIKISKQTLGFWYQIEGGTYATLSLKESNIIPLCFYVNGNDFKVGSFAKERSFLNDPNSFDNYFELIKDPSKYFTLHEDSKPIKQLLYYGIENYLSHFVKTILYKNESIEAFRTNFCVRFWFDADVEKPERILVVNLFKEAGYENIKEISVDAHLNKELHVVSHSGRARVCLSAIANDLYVKFFSTAHNSLVTQFKLEELGSDPRAKILANLIIEDIKEASPFLHINEENEIGYIINHCTRLLTSLKPIMRDEIELSNGVKADYKVRLSHLEQRLMYNRGIEDKVIPELESIISENNLTNSIVDLILVGDAINTNYFKEKLTKKFPNVFGVPSAIESKLLQSIFAEIASSGYLIKPSSNINTSGQVNSSTPGAKTPPVAKTPPRVNTPPVIKTPPLIKAPPFVKAPPMLNTPPLNGKSNDNKLKVATPPVKRPDAILPPPPKVVKMNFVPPPPPPIKKNN